MILKILKRFSQAFFYIWYSELFYKSSTDHKKAIPPHNDPISSFHLLYTDCISKYTQHPFLFTSFCRFWNGLWNLSNSPLNQQLHFCKSILIQTKMFTWNWRVDFNKHEINIYWNISFLTLLDIYHCFLYALYMLSVL